MRRRHLILAFILIITPPEMYAEDQPGLCDFFQAIGQVESGHDDDAVGDGGASIGRYQIQRPYWIDATEFDQSIGGKYEDVKDAAYARKVMEAYFKRYARKAWGSRDWHTLSRIHNGGPRGHKKAATLVYWAKVKKELENP